MCKSIIPTILWMVGGETITVSIMGERMERNSEKECDRIKRFQTVDDVFPAPVDGGHIGGRIKDIRPRIILYLYGSI